MELERLRHRLLVQGEASTQASQEGAESSSSNGFLSVLGGGVPPTPGRGDYAGCRDRKHRLASNL